MIKHRFIVRGADDFRIFAAIPCEKQVLTWKKWVRPPDWEEFKQLRSAAITSCVSMSVWWRKVADRWKQVRDGIVCPELPPVSPTEPARVSIPDIPADRLAADTDECADGIDALVAELQRANENLDFGAAVLAFTSLQETIGERQDDTETIRIVSTWAKQYAARVKTGYIPPVRLGGPGHPNEKSKHREFEVSSRASARVLSEIAALMEGVLTERILALKAFKASAELTSSDPLPDTPCPPGTPFAAYAIEFQGSIFSIVEGCAWVAARNLSKRFSKRSEDKAQRPGPDGVYPPTPSELWFKVDTVTLDKLSAEHTRGCYGISVADQDRLVEEMQTALLATDEEKRVVEIVTQMLVERGLNPKAPERIPVVEADPKHANQQREAERRDQQENRAPKVRTIKFHVSPPRYLREAAERIFASPGKHKKAHWVIGHWRNQAWGVQHKEHRQKWIKPHIRGLGEAGAVVARVAASDEEVAAIEPSSDAPPSPPPILH